MRACPIAVAALLVVAACGGTTSRGASNSPIVTASGAPSASASASPATTASPSPGPAALVHCSAAIPAGDNLVIGTVVGDPTVVVRDIQDPANAHNVCNFDTAAQSPQFVSATSVAYETPGHQIITADLSSGATTLIATYAAGFDSGEYAVSPDGRSVTYLDGNAWHVAGPSGNRTLTTLPDLPARGTSPDEDDSFLGYSPDGQYIALFQTFHTGGTGETAADQIRKAGDGSLVYSANGMTMAVWTASPSRLFFRNASGDMQRWDPTGGLSSVTSLRWIRPRASPDGRWIAYTFRAPSGLGGIGFFSVPNNKVTNTTPPGRSGVRFLTNDLVWYAGERACSTCFGGAPAATGVTYIYDIAGATEVTSRLSSAIDLWPH